MKRGIMIILSILILIVGSASVYAAGEPIGVPTAPPPPQTAAPAAQEPTTVQIMQIKPEHQGSTIFVYDVSAQKVDRYVETEKGKLKYVDSAPYTLEKWRDFASQGDPDYLSNPMTSEEANTELMKRGATPKPQVTSAPQATQPPVQALVQPPAAETKPEEKTAHTYPEAKKEAEKAPETKPAAPAPAAKPPETGLQKIVSDKIGTEQAVATAQAKYEAEKKAYDAADAKNKAALAAYNANPNKETETAWHNALIELADASMKKDEAAIKLQDEQIALAQKQEEIKSFTQPERAKALERAKERQERQKELLAEKESLDRDMKNTEDIIDATEDRIDEIEDEEGKEAEKEYLETYLKEQKEKLKGLKKESETNKANIEKQKPIAGAASADVRLNEIDNEMFALNRDVTVSNEEYKRIQQERIGAENDIKEELQSPEIKAEYDKLKAIPEKDRTPAQQAEIERYEYKLEEYTAALKDWTAQEARAKADFEAKQKEAKSKTRNLEKEKAEVQYEKKKYELRQEIAEHDKKIAELRAELAKATGDKDEDTIKDLEEKIALEEAKKEKKQDDLLWMERNWPSRVVFLINEFMQGYEEYKGIGQWSSLVLSDEDLAKRRQRAAEKFCNDIWFLAGTKCWQSRLCEMWFPREAPVAQNTLVTEVGIGGYLPAASIQADKSFPMPYMAAGQTKSMHTYKITYIMENPLDVGLTYHIELRGDRTFKSDERILERKTMEKSGGKEGRLGSDPLIFDSEYNYESACLVFSPRIMNSNGGYVNEICSPITQYSGAATKPYTLPADTLAAVQNSTGTSTGVSMTGA